MPDNISQSVEVGVKGRFSLRAVKADGSGERDLAEFDNLILDIGLEQLCKGAYTMSSVRVGAGSTPPAASQTQLVSQIAAKTGATPAQRYSTTAPYWFSITFTWRFEAGVAAGNIAEVGVGWENTGATLFSRALVLDNNGNPTTVTVLSDEFLDVSYTLTFYPSADDSRATITLAGSSYEVLSRMAYAGTSGWVAYLTYLSQNPLKMHSASYAYSGEIGPVTGIPTGSSASANPTVTLLPYTAGSFVCEVDLRYGLNDLVLASGIRSLRIIPYAFSSYQMQFTPAIPKTSSQILTIRFRLTFTRR